MRAVVLFITLAVFAFPLYPQTTPAPAKLDDLVRRAGEFRRLLAAGNRVKASEFVIPTDRDEFLNNPVAAIQNPRTAGVDFLDKDRVQVRTAGRMVMAPGGGIPQLTETVITDTWVWRQNNWYFQTSSPDGGFVQRFSGDASADAAALQEIKSSFKLPADVIKAGDLIQGDRKYISVPFEYTGSSPIRIEAKMETPLATLDLQSAVYLTQQSKAFGVWVHARDIDSGPFNTTLVVTVYYKGVAADHTLRFEGNIVALFKYRQVPEVVPPDSKANFQLFIRNDTGVTVELNAISDDGKFFVNDFPKQLGPGEEGVITLRRNIAASTPGRKIGLVLNSPVTGETVYDVKVR